MLDSHRPESRQASMGASTFLAQSCLDPERVWRWVLLASSRGEFGSGLLDPAGSTASPAVFGDGISLVQEGRGPL